MFELGSAKFYDNVLYIAGYPTPAEAAVRKARSKSGEDYEVLEGGIVAGCSPNPNRVKCGCLRVPPDPQIAALPADRLTGTSVQNGSY